MSDRTRPIKAAQRFAEMLQRAESSESFQIEGIKVEIAEQICRAMERQQINKAELARRLGKSPAYVTKVLQGNTNFTLESLVKIARALSCQIELTLKAVALKTAKPRLTKQRAASNLKRGVDQKRQRSQRVTG